MVLKPIVITTFVIVLCFGSVGAVMAFLITYEEYSHHYASKKEPFRHAMQTAVFTFFVFFVLAMIAGFFLSKMF